MDTILESETHLSELNLLYNLGKTFSAVLDLSELLVDIVDAAVTLAHANEGLLILTEPDSDRLILKAERQAGDDIARALDQVTEDTLASHVLAHGMPLLLNAGDPLSTDGDETITTRSLVYVPLITKGRTIGILGVADKAGNAVFNTHDLDMLAGLGGYAAIAIENARLYHQALDRTLELSLLVESANALSWSLDLGRVLDAIARHMMRSLQAHWCIISDWRPETNTIGRLAEHRLALWPPDKGLQIDIQTFPIHSHVLASAGVATAYASEGWLAQLGYRRMLVIPIRHNGYVVGLAEISNLHEDQSFTSAQINLCLRRILDLGAQIRDYRVGYSENYLLEAGRMLISAAGADWCSIYSCGNEPDTLIRMLDYGSGIWVKEPGPILEGDDFPTLHIVLQEQRIGELQSTDPELDDAEKALFENIGDGSLLLLPLVVKGKTVGLVQLYDLHPDRHFSDREIGLARALANQAAVALENAHLVQDLQDSLDELKAMQSHLVRAARLSALGELAAMIAHQINNPLTTILGDADILVQDIPTDDPAYESALAIRRAGARAKQVVERMLNMARYEDEARPLDVNHTVHEAIELVGAQIKQLGIKLEVDLALQLPPIQSVPGQLEDIWMNLLSNARDAVIAKSNGTGCIHIQSGLVKDKKQVEISVQDDGDGIEADDLPLIFDPFFTTKPRGKGTGLGLYICRQIVQEHSGEIDVTSTPGEGTCVTVRLPAIVTLQKEQKHGLHPGSR
ncbi:MAG: GAF domain-containing protein [Anaerolineae bacterium]|nr:GAF domain-containing protein [Anaerolineae bacterium]